MRSGLVTIRPRAQEPSEDGRRTSCAGWGAFQELTQLGHERDGETKREEGSESHQDLSQVGHIVRICISGRYQYRQWGEESR